jgi:hypothetical protein
MTLTLTFPQFALLFFAAMLALGVLASAKR